MNKVWREQLDFHFQVKWSDGQPRSHPKLRTMKATHLVKKTKSTSSRRILALSLQTCHLGSGLCVCYPVPPIQPASVSHDSCLVRGLRLATLYKPGVQHLPSFFSTSSLSFLSIPLLLVICLYVVPLFLQTDKEIRRVYVAAIIE